MYEVKIDVFEGPLDLLVYLVQKQELNLSQISIADITDQYIRYLNEIGVQNLSNTGDFLVMASRLMLLKVREILQEEEDEDDLDLSVDKQQILQQVMDHQVFKKVSEYFQKKELDNIGSFSRGFSESTSLKIESDILEKNVDTFDLLSSFVKLVCSQQEKIIHEVSIDDVTIETQMQQLRQFLLTKSVFDLRLFCQKDSRNIFLVVTFMAVLEMVKLEEIVIQQNQFCGEVKVYQKETNYKISSEDVETEWSQDILEKDILCKLKINSDDRKVTELESLIQEVKQEEECYKNLLLTLEKSPLQLLDI